MRSLLIVMAATTLVVSSVMVAASATEWEYLDITIELVDEQREPHPTKDGMDILTLELDVTNHGRQLLDGDDHHYVQIVIVDELAETEYGQVYWVSGPRAVSCPQHQQDVGRGQTGTWSICFGIPTEDAPDILRVHSYPDVGPYRSQSIQFHSYSPTCSEIDGYFCAEYTLDGRQTYQEWMSTCQTTHDGSLRSAERIIRCYRDLMEVAIEELMFYQEWSDLLHDGLMWYENRPWTTIEETDLVASFHDSKGNRYSWTLPIESFEDAVVASREKSENLWQHPVRLNNDGETLVSTSLEGFVHGTFVNVIGDVYDNSDSNADFIWEVWYIVSQLSVYEEDVDQHSEGRYANETFWRGGGDCEDLAILIADMLVSSEHTSDWVIQYIYMDLDNPDDPQEVNHIALFVNDGINSYFIEATAPPAWDYYPQGVVGWYFDVQDDPQG